MKKFISIFAALCVVVCMVSTFLSDCNTAVSPSYAIGGVVNEQTQRFIRYTFSQAASPEDLALRICRFAYRNFTYDLTTMKTPQLADTNRFIFENDFRGVCLDFAVFTKAVFSVICQDKGWDYTSCYVALGNNPLQGSGHAVNYISIAQPDGTYLVYELDVTRDLNQFTHFKKPQELAYRFVVEDSEQIRDAVIDCFRDFYKYPMNALA